MEPRVKDWRGYEVVDSDGSKIGTIEDFFVDRVTDEPEWALVNMGLFGTRQTLVPFDGATVEDDRLRVRYEKAMIKDAPSLEPGNTISEEELADLYSYYRLSSPTGAADPDTPLSGDERGAGATSAEAMGPDERELADREREVRETQDELRERQAELEARQDSLEQRGAELETRVEELSEREGRLDERQGGLEQRQAETARMPVGGEPDYARERPEGDGGAYEAHSGGTGSAGEDRRVGSSGAGGRLRRFGGPS